MVEMLKRVSISLESVKRRTFAIAHGWPGWARSGRDDQSAIQNLCTYGPRYAVVLQSTPYAFEPPSDPEAFHLVERLEGNSTTDFGAPALPILGESEPVDAEEREKSEAILRASWRSFDEALAQSKGVALRKGPRGGGRDQGKLLSHVIMADKSYLAKLGWKVQLVEGEDPLQALPHIRDAILAGLQAAVNGEIPAKGPRGGLHWTPRFFVRRVIWHILDHTWEIEDRMT